MVRKKNLNKNNKGFSLIEVIIAVAILTLLMTPIISQVVKTLNTSANAKERQYAVENAEYVLNTFQETPIATLNGVNSNLVSLTTPLATPEKVGQLSVTAGETVEEFDCTIYVVSNSAYDGSDGLEKYMKQVKLFNKNPEANPVVDLGTADEIPIVYRASVYQLTSEKLGRKHYYNRTVVVDNLNTQLLHGSYVIETNFTPGQKKDITTVDSDLSINSEGAAVHYDAYGRIDKVVVSQISGVRDPNGSGTSYLQDLDSTKVAIIQGSASNYDQQAEYDLYNIRMMKLKGRSTNPWERTSDWYSEIINKTGTGVLNEGDYLDTVSKMTKISIVSGYETNGSDKKHFYDVDCMVYYESYLSSDTSTPEVPEVLSYNAFSRRFYTNQAPDIYFVYEPYSADGTRYSQNDYILTYDGVIYGEGEKRSKLYIIKPGSCRIAQGSTTSTYTTTLGYGETDPHPVNVYVDYLLPKSVSAVTDRPVSIPTGAGALKDVAPMQIFTNIDLTNFKQEDVGRIAANTRKGVQYAAKLDTYYGVWSSKPSTEVDGEIDRDTTTEYARVNYPVQFKYDGTNAVDTINPMSEDKMQSNRVYSVRVKFDRTDEDGLDKKGYSVSLTGAKGAE